MTINFANRKPKKRVEKANYKAFMLDAEAYQQEIINPRDINPSKKRKYNNFSESDHDASSNENIDKKTLPKMSQPLLDRT